MKLQAGHRIMARMDDHTTVEQVISLYVYEEMLAKEESAAVARMALFGTIHCRGVLRHAHIMSWYRRPRS